MDLLMHALAESDAPLRVHPRARAREGVSQKALTQTLRRLERERSCSPGRCIRQRSRSISSSTW